MATITFTQDTSYKERPFAGTENWNGQDYAGIPSSSNRAQRLDYYFRFAWPQLEGSVQGSYNWSRFDQEIRKAIDRRQRFTIGGVMTMCPGGCDPFNGTVNYDGAPALYPQYLHNLMQSESNKDRIMGGTWVPNWNSNHYLGRMEALLNAWAAYIDTATYKPSWSATPIRYKDVINGIDVRFMGSWGEWHHASIADPVNSVYPAHMRPTVATHKRIFDAHKTAFPNIPIFIMWSTFDHMFFNNTQVTTEVGVYALQSSNNWGPYGYRKDHYGSDQWSNSGNYDHAYGENNNATFNGSPAMKTYIMDRWKTSPLTGEPEGPGSNIPNLVAEVSLYKPTSIGNGNFSSPGGDNNMRAAVNIMGHKLRATSANITNTPNSLAISVNWTNSGQTPTYENWDVVYELVGTSWKATSTFKPKRFMGSTTTSETFPVSVPAGNYQLKMTVKDPTGYRAYMPLFMTGQATDGSFNLGTYSFSGTTTNQPPVANAGADKSITLPTNSVSLVGTGTDPDGTIASSVWSRVSGSGTITSPNSLNTTISGLTQGTSVFRLTITDNQGASDNDDVTVVTLPEVINQAPVVNAGTNQTITLPTASITLTGVVNDPDGTVITTVWSRVSGSGDITAPNALATQITALEAGTSVFRLTATDNDGASTSDNVSITVNTAANTTPIVNAGLDQTITLPTNSVTLTATASDAEGPVSVTWTRVSGSGSAVSPTSTTTQIVNLTEGISVFRITATDSQGATDTDTVSIIVNPAPVPGTVKADAGVDQKVLLPKTTTTLDGSLSGTATQVKSWGWRRIIGPTATITNSNKAVANVADLQEGIYIFELRVVDINNIFTVDTVAVVVEKSNTSTKTVVSVTLQTATYKVTYSDGTTEIF